MHDLYFLIAPVDGGTILLLIVLLILGTRLVQENLRLRLLGKRIALAAFFVFVLLSAHEWQPDTADEWVAIILRSLVFAGIVLGAVWTISPVLAFVGSVLIRPVIKTSTTQSTHRGETAAEKNRRRLEEAEQRKRDAEWHRNAPQRERDRLAAEAQARTEADQSASDRHRREEARLSCLLLRDQFSTELSNRFTRERLDEYFATYMTDTHSPEEVEARAAQLRSMIEQALAASGAAPKKQFRTLIEISEYFQALREDAAKSNYDSDIVESIIARYHAQENKAVEEFFKS